MLLIEYAPTADTIQQDYALVTSLPQLDALIARPDAIVHPVLRQALPPLVLQAFSQGLANALHTVFQVGFWIASLALAPAP